MLAASWGAAKGLMTIAVPQKNGRCRSIKVSYFLRDLPPRHLVRALKAHYPFAKMPLLELFTQFPFRFSWAEDKDGVSTMSGEKNLFVVVSQVAHVSSFALVRGRYHLRFIASVR